MPRHARHLLLALLALLIGSASVGLTQPAGAATPTSSTGIMITLTDSAGATLPNIAVAVQEQQSDGTWMGPQYGPLLTDDVGQFFWSTTAGHKYRFCFADNYYWWDNTPAKRYKSACYANAAFNVDTATVLTGTSGVQNITQVLALDGMAMTATYPWVTGTPSVGKTLTVADPGIAAPTDATISYQWVYWNSTTQKEVAISGATGRSLLITSDLAGKWPTARVTSKKAGYATVVLSDGVGMVGGTNPTSANPLTITGTDANHKAVAGTTLTASWGPFTPAVTADTRPMYAWFVEGQQVTDTTDTDTFAVTSAYAGKRISVRGEFYNWDQRDNEMKGYATTLGTLTTAVPTITGSAVVNSTLTAVPGAWGPAPVTLRYQWYGTSSTGTRTAITGATAKTYKLVTADIGQKISVRVTGSKTDYTSVAKLSANTTAVQGVFTTQPVPTITGTRKVGVTLTANTGTWAPTPTSYTYQWSRSGVAIAGATAPTYTLVEADGGATITVSVKAIRSGYVSATKTSAPTAAIAKLLTGTTPTVTGTKAVGNTLTANAGAWSPAPVTLTYQWYRGTTAIAGATGTTYALTAADQGLQIRVKVTGTKTGYATLSKYSAYTAAIA